MKHLKSYAEKFPTTVEQLRQQLYVDGEAQSVEEAAQMIRPADEIFKATKMDLCKWTTNSREFARSYPRSNFRTQ